MVELNSLDVVVKRAINGLEAGDTKKEAIDSITAFVENNYIRPTLKDINSMDVNDAIELNKRHGIEFNIADGKVIGIRMIGGLN